MRFSICTTNYNCAYILRQHLDSIYALFKSEDFEYLVVDSKSKDNSVEIYREYQKKYNNIWLKIKKCSRGIGRQLAFKNSKTQFIVQIDTDTIFWPVWKEFIEICIEKHPDVAIQGFDSGVYPRKLMEQINGWGNFLYYDDFDLWMRMWEIGKMRWYPLPQGENVKEHGATDFEDMFSTRYEKLEKLIRLIRHEFDWVRLHRYRKMDIEKMWKENIVDLGIGEMQDTWFGNRGNLSLIEWLGRTKYKLFKILED